MQQNLGGKRLNPFHDLSSTLLTVCKGRSKNSHLKNANLTPLISYNVGPHYQEKELSIRPECHSGQIQFRQIRKSHNLIAEESMENITSET